MLDISQYLLYLLYLYQVRHQEAYDLVDSPLMAMIGGTLAIAKDLINADDDAVTKIKGKESSTSQDIKLNSNELEDT